jgi:hypothetical protein
MVIFEFLMSELEGGELSVLLLLLLLWVVVVVVVSASESSLLSFLATCSGKDDSIDSIFIAAVAMEEEEGEDANEKVENSADAAVTLRRVVRAVRGLLALSPPLESFLRDLVMVLISEVNSSAKQGGGEIITC